MVSRLVARPRDDLDAALAHELADCLWSVIALADAYGVDLEAAFVSTMRDLTQHLGSTSRGARHDYRK